MSMQERIENYWQDEASRYSSQIWKEMNGFKKDAWIKLIDEYRPAGDKLKILDIGTGPGFFAMILSQMGHTVTAVDCTDNMLKEAEHNAEIANVDVEFYKMDSHELDFPDETFDLIVCRNLTWTLRDPQKAYREWNRVLKSKGRILVFDANWCLRLFDEELRKMCEEDSKIAKSLGITDNHHDSDMEESDNISINLFLSSKRRPQWDASALIEASYDKVFVEVDITDKVWDDRDKVLYRSTPMFLVGAEKK